MSEPMWLGGDPASYANDYEETQSAECGECGQESEFPAYAEYSNRIVSWYAEWKCKFCGYPNTSEGWYDPNDDN